MAVPGHMGSICPNILPPNNHHPDWEETHVLLLPSIVSHGPVWEKTANAPPLLLASFIKHTGGSTWPHLSHLQGSYLLCSLQSQTPFSYPTPPSFTCGFRLCPLPIWGLTTLGDCLHLSRSCTTCCAFLYLFQLSCMYCFRWGGTPELHTVFG